MLIEILFFIALALLVVEALNPTMGIFGFGGFIAYVVGVWMLVSSDAEQFYGLSITNVIILGFVFFAALAILVIYLYRVRHKNVETGIEYLTNKPAKVQKWKNGKGTIFIDGEDWRAKGPENLNIGDEVIVTGYEKMTLTVKAK